MSVAARIRIPGRMLWLPAALLLTLAPPAQAGWALFNDPHGDAVRRQPREAAPAGPQSPSGTGGSAAQPEQVQAEAAGRRLDEEAQMERIRRLALQEQAEARQQAEEQRLAREAAQLQRLQAQAAQEQAEARQQAEEQRLAREAAQLQRLQAQAAQEQAEARQQAEEQRLALEAAQLQRLQAQAAQEQAEARQQAEEQRLARVAVSPSAVERPSGKDLPAAAEATTRPEEPRAEVGNGGYRIGPGDLLDVAVWKDEALTRTLMVSPDGRIAFPLIGLLQAEGKTVEELKGELIGKLSPFVPDPVISVEVRQVNSLQVYIIGRVNAPGRFQLNGNTSVLQALAMAGGLTPFADGSEIKVMRQEGARTHSYPFHYNKVVKGQRLDQNILLQRGDVIVVP